MLEYLAIRVMPLWNATEQLLSKAMTYPDNKLFQGLLTKSIVKLTSMMNQESIMRHLGKYLRFPHMKVNVIDYGNANAWQALKLDKFRDELGILSRAGRKLWEFRIRTAQRYIGWLSDKRL